MGENTGLERVALERVSSVKSLKNKSIIQIHPSIHPKLACSRSQNLGNKSEVFSHWMGWIWLVQLLKYFHKKSVGYCNACVSWLGSGLISIKRQKQRTKAEVKSRVCIYFFSECTEAKTHHHLGQQEQRRGCFVLAAQEPASFPVDQSSSLPCYLFITPFSYSSHLFLTV